MTHLIRRRGHLDTSLFVCLLLTILSSLRFSNATSLHLSNDFDFPDVNQETFANALKKYDICIPTKVDHTGRFLSHQLHHHIGRTRRDVASPPTDDIKSVNYKLEVDGEELHLSLRPNDKFLGPGIAFETRSGGHRSLSDSVIHLGRDKHCHFVGHVKDHPGSSVAIATCNGLHGMFTTKQGHYFIEPIKGHNLTFDPKHPHLVYKPTSLPQHLFPYAPLNEKHTDNGCGVNGTFEDAEKARETWQKENVPHDERSHRRKRSVSREHHVELLVVVDKSMMAYHKRDDIDNYILTIINMVSNIFHDASLGNAVSIVLVRVMKLMEDEEGLKITHHADHTLNSFCQWQTRVNPAETSPIHHDVAILITRHNICSRMNKPCSTLGLAQVSGMCQPHRSCNVNEDTGLVVAFTIAHELGHNFNMRHDGTQNACQADGLNQQFVMSPLLSVSAAPLVWSNCSRQSITRFLDRGWGFCLNDEPDDHSFEFPEAPPGVMYDANHQCRLQFGPGATQCDYIDDLCQALWCRSENKCLTRLEAAAQGTICGKNKWCSGGRCVTIGDTPMAIDGQWGEWQSWTPCTASCNAGVSISERHCAHPPPQNGGKYCLGERRRYRICNVNPCPEGVPSMREVQCSEFNSIPYRGQYLEWQVLPKTDQVAVCQLHCKPRGRFFSVMLKEAVTDGTPCRLGSRDMCIGGRCRRVGCDWKIDSAAVEDHCGVCHGDGSSCKMVQREFKKKYGLGYVEAMVIPAGARNIRVEEVAEASNYLALRSDDGHYYLNGGWFIQWSGDYKAAGTVVHYTRDGNKESCSALGPLREDLHIMLLFQSDNPGVKVNYTVPNENATRSRTPVFTWQLLDWTHCTASCGGGFQRREAVCVETEAGIVENRYCNASSKPDDLLMTCNSHMCPARWWMGPWQRCSVTCGEGGMHRRTVLCIRSLGPDNQMALEDHECEGLVKPTIMEPCHHDQPCPEPKGTWIASPWAPHCGQNPCAVQQRQVICSDDVLGCDDTERPLTQRPCSDVICGVWQESEWSRCTVTCGEGRQYRSVRCIGGDYCYHGDRPANGKPCYNAPCVTSTPATSTTTQAQYDSYRKWMHQRAKNNDAIDGHDNTLNTTYNLENSANTISRFNLSNIENDELQNDTSSTTHLVNKSLPSNDKRNHENGILEKDIGQPFLSERLHVGDTSTRQPVDKSVIPSLTARMLTSSETGPSRSGIQRQGDRYRWRPLEWGLCSKRCGSGIKRRQVECISTSNHLVVADYLCDSRDKMADEAPCDEGPCHDWTVTGWSECSTSCGDGVMVRQVTCSLDDLCDLEVKPTLEQQCSLGPCLKWITGPWGQCSTSCGTGQQIRNVQCVNVHSQYSGSGCDLDARPVASQSCNLDPCPVRTGALESSFHCIRDEMSHTMCRALFRMGRCNQSRISRKCCRTCHKETAPHHNTHRRFIS